MKMKRRKSSTYIKLIFLPKNINVPGLFEIIIIFFQHVESAYDLCISAIFTRSCISAQLPMNTNATKSHTIMAFWGNVIIRFMVSSRLKWNK
jgi:hypothetical protein